MSEINPTTYRNRVRSQQPQRSNGPRNGPALSHDAYWEFAVATEKAILAERDAAQQRWREHKALCGALLVFVNWMEQHPDAVAAERLLQLLRCIAPGQGSEPVRVSRLAEWCGLHIGTASVALGELRRRGLVEKAPGKSNQGGYRAIEQQDGDGA